jgi:hypothetical protein
MTIKYDRVFGRNTDCKITDLKFEFGLKKKNGDGLESNSWECLEIIFQN